ncbi:MAG: hypothetical protein Q9162_007672 [Coniocarpon cinnabarinum]
MSRSTSSRALHSHPASSLLARPHISRSIRPVLARRHYAKRQPSPRNDAERPDFKSQLWQSTTERVQREKEEQERFARIRNVGGGGGGGVATTLSLLFACVVAYGLGSMTAPKLTTSSTLSLKDSPELKHDLSENNLQAAWADFRSIVGEENVSTTDADRDTHAGSAWSSYSHTPNDRPFCIVKPGSTEDVSKIMNVCHSRQIPVVPYSGGTSLEGHFASLHRGICIDFSRMDQILAVHADDLDCTVQPAVGWETLNEELAKEGLFFPPDPGPGAMIGGMVGTGCSGTNAYRYGTMRDWVVNLTVVMADGTIVKTRQRPRKSSAGYDLTRLFIGSEGTLGLVTEATLKLTAAPKNQRVAVATFGSIKDAAECVSKTVREGIPIAAVELLDEEQMRCVNLSGSTSKQWKESPTLFFKFSGPSQGAVKDSIASVQAQAKKTGSKSFEFARNEEEASELWSARKEALWSCMAATPYPVEETHVWTTDVAVPISRLPDIVEETKKDMKDNSLVGTIVGHVGDGNFHAIILYDDKRRQVTADVVHRMVERALAMEGTATGEHGVGVIKKEYLLEEVGQTGVDAMRALKKAWDPMGLLNPDKIVQIAR